jgi:large subunit ribosomal protein L5
MTDTAVTTSSGNVRAEKPRLKAKYDDEIRNQLKETLGLANIMEVPRLEKIVINMGVGRAVQQPSLLENAVKDLTLITGQKPLTTKATKSIAGFKLREGNSIGAKVTLRGDRAWEFLDRLVSMAIPRIRDFRGLPAHSFDGRGNYTFGVTEQLIFPEIDYDKIDQPRGMDISIVTTARTNDEGKAFLDAFGFPFKKEGDEGYLIVEPQKKRRGQRGPQGKAGAKTGKRK